MLLSILSSAAAAPAKCYVTVTAPSVSSTTVVPSTTVVASTTVVSSTKATTVATTTSAVETKTSSTALPSSTAVPKGQYQFIVLGDSGRTPSKYPSMALNAAAMEKVARANNVGHLVEVGDNFYEDSVAELAANVSYFDAFWKQPFKKDFPTVDQLPWHSLLGNHDYCISPVEQIQYHEAKWRMDNFFWNYTVSLPSGKKIAFLYLDVNLINYGLKLDAKQLKKCPKMQEWFDKFSADPANNWTPQAHLQKIESMLQDAQKNADWIFGFSHQPIGGGVCPEDTANLLPISDLFEKYKAQAFFNGHAHVIGYGKSRTVAHFTSGAGSKQEVECEATNPSQWSLANKGGFILATVKDDDMQVQFYDQEANPVFNNTVKRV
ncbi:Metallo-dependent phosphatase-like protein [Gorgonomyces haynaldii]|nr:Metallo-dependent phosphatase-like protein [Gorgonomyces haynaldii]